MLLTGNVTFIVFGKGETELLFEITYLLDVIIFGSLIFFVVAAYDLLDKCSCQTDRDRDNFTIRCSLSVQAICIIVKNC